MITRISAKLSFGDPGYIGLPYWPERNTLIDIGKDVHPRLGPAKKEAALLAACEKHRITRGQYDEICELAARPFYTDNAGRDGEIVIPQRVIQSFINNTSQSAPKVIPRIDSKGLTFIGVTLDGGSLRTGMHESDAKKFERFVRMARDAKSGRGSNQPIWCSSDYIANFIACGIFMVEEEIIKAEDLRKLMEYGGRWFGVGSARPQGFGRFQVIEWDLM
jgi:hypothetical protein